MTNHICGHNGCQASFSGSRLLIEHKRSQHQELFPFICAQANCDFRADTQNNLSQHIRNHHGIVQYPCEFSNCGKQYAKIDSYNSHRRSAHPQSLPCTFPGCSYLFDSRSSLNKHSLVHQGSLPHVCGEQGCGRSFATVSELHIHEVTSHGRSLCVICPKTVKNLFLLQLHASAHPGQLRCGDCSSTSVKGHFQKTHHSGTFPLQAELVGKTIRSIGCLVIQNIQRSDQAGRPMLPSQQAAPPAPLPVTAPKPPRQPRTATQRAPAQAVPQGTPEIPQTQQQLFLAHVAARGNTSPGTPAETTPSPSITADATELLSWSNARYAVPFIDTVVCTSGRVVEILKKLCKTESLRGTVANLKIQKSTSSVKQIDLITNGITQPFQLERYRINSRYGDRLTQILNRLARRASGSEPGKLPTFDRLWLLRGALCLLTNELHKEPSAPTQKLISLPRPFLRQDPGTVVKCHIPFWGHGRSQKLGAPTEWSSVWELDVATMLRCKVIDAVDDQHIEWVDTTNVQLTGINLADVQVVQVLKLAKQIAVTGGAWIGSKEECLGYASEVCTADWLASLRDGNLCTFRRDLRWGLGILKPATWILNRAVRKLSPIKMNSPTTDEIWWVIDAILQGLCHNLSVEEAWREGAAMALQLKNLALEGTPSFPTVPCEHPEISNAMHVCPGCWSIRVCSDFVESRSHFREICQVCIPKKQLKTVDVALDVTEYLRLSAIRLFETDIKAGKLERSRAEIEVAVEALLANLQPYLVDNARVRDAYIEQELTRDIRPIHMTADGQRQNPLAISLDAILRAFPGGDGKTAYHHPENVVPCCMSINLLMRHYEKPLLRAMEAMVTATKDNAEDRRKYEQGLLLFRTCLQNSYEMGSLGDARLSQRINKPLPANMPDIVEALRTGKPLPRTIKTSTVYRVNMKSAQMHNRGVDWKFPTFKYVMKNIYAAAKMYGLDTADHRQLWLRNGAFCPYAMDCALPNEYSHGTIWEIFCVRFERMRNLCDWREKTNPDRQSVEIGELMVAVAHLWFINVKRDLDQGIPADRCGRDELGLIPHPTLRWLLTSSIGHRHHANAMTTGISGWDPAQGTLCTFDHSKCNICWETWGCNNIKFCFSEKFYPDIFGLLPKLRKKPVDGTKAIFELPDLPTGQLRTESFSMFESINIEDDWDDSEVIEDMSVASDTEPSFVTVHDDDPFHVDQAVMENHPELTESTIAENPGFVPGFTDLRDYGLDEKGQQLILDEVRGAAVAQPSNLQVFRSLTDDAIARINPDDPGRDGFRLALNVIKRYYAINGGAEYASIANKILEHLRMSDFDVQVSIEKDIVDTLSQAMSSTETAGDEAATVMPQTPPRRERQIPELVEPESRGLKGDSSAKRVVIKDDAYGGSPTKTGRKKLSVRLLDPEVATANNPSRLASGLGLRSFSSALPRMPSFQVVIDLPSTESTSAAPPSQEPQSLLEQFNEAAEQQQAQEDDSEFQPSQEEENPEDLDLF